MQKNHFKKITFIFCIIILFFLFGLFFFAKTRAFSISNVVVFGDSLSDVGNFPESSQVLSDAKAAPTLENYVSSFYVPFSNPVNTQEKGAWPDVNSDYLSKPASIADQSQPRAFRSFSWTQFFLMQAKEKGLINNANIAPSILLSSQKIPNDLSVDYAWGYATTGSGCINPYYHSIKCTASSIEAARNAYVNNQNPQNFEAIEVPNLLMQIQLFEKDRAEKLIDVNAKTHYVIWSGGNDLISSYNALTQRKNPLPILAFSFGSGAIHIVYAAKTVFNDFPKDQKPGVIYAFNLFNPNLTPFVYGTLKGKFASVMTHIFNFWLSVDAGAYNLFSKNKIVVVPAYDWFQKAASDPDFQKHSGKACQMEKQESNNCSGFLFWNAVHPASTMEQKIGNNFFDLVCNGSSLCGIRYPNSLSVIGYHR